MITIKQIEEAFQPLKEVKEVEFPKFKPSGTNAVKLDLGGFEITIINNQMLQEGYAILSEDIYEKVYAYFENLKPEHQ